MSIEIRRALTTALSLRRVLAKSRFSVRFAQIAHPSAPCFVLGNGPSLASDLRSRFDEIAKCDIVCVGRFAETDMYRALKPKIYAIADPVLWLGDAPGKMIEARENLFDRIAADTDWPIQICAPFEAMAYLERRLQSNTNISVTPFNNVPLWGDVRVLHRLFDMNLGMPAAQTVLIVALFIALRTGHRNIYLLGADHSWHETVALDERNRVCLRDRHFYDKDAGLLPFSIDGSDDKIFTMCALFDVLSKMFEGHERIAEYASHLGASVINLSSTTYIDAYKRRKLSMVDRLDRPE